MDMFRSPCKTFKLANVMSGDENSIKSLLTLFRDDHQGLYFVKDCVLPEHSFIAIEATWWAIEHGEDITNEGTALKLFQVRTNIL
jgi:hypothetical protein